MERATYTLVAQLGECWRGVDEKGRMVLLVPDPGAPADFEPMVLGGSALAALLDRAEIDEQPHLVYRWSAGSSLLERLQSGPLPIPEVVSLGLGLLDALAALNAPCFGPIQADRIAYGSQEALCLAALLPAGSRGVHPVQEVAQLLYLCLCDRPLEQDSEGRVIPPSQFRKELEAKLEDVLLAALQTSNPDLGPLRAGLHAWLLTREPGQQTSPVQILLNRMKGGAGFPAMAQAVAEINKIGEGDGEKLQALASIILRDFSLTQQVLRLANSTIYGVAGGVSTISRALMVLGFATVKALALNLLLIEQLSNKEQAQSLLEELSRSFFASLLTRQLAQRARYRDLEEVRVAGMFHGLGRLLVACYCPGEQSQINALIESGETEARAVQKVLQLDYAELGMTLAREWFFPERLVGSMAVESEKPRPPRQEHDWLRLLANAGEALMQATLQDDEGACARAWLQARDRFGEALALEERDLRQALSDACDEAIRDAPLFGLGASQVICRLRDGPTASPKAVPVAKVELKPSSSGEGPQDRPQVVAALTQGVGEVTETLLGEGKLNDVLRVILETLYQALNPSRILLATRNPQIAAMVGRFGFGKDIERFLPRFQIPLDGAPDMVQMALLRQVDLRLEDTRQGKLSMPLPSGLAQLAGGRSMLIMPLSIEKKRFGLLYLDHKQVGGLTLGEKEWALCQTLRNQAVLAIKQYTPSAPPH